MSDALAAKVTSPGLRRAQETGTCSARAQATRHHWEQVPGTQPRHGRAAGTHLDTWPGSHAVCADAQVGAIPGEPGAAASFIAS